MFFGFGDYEGPKLDKFEGRFAQMMPPKKSDANGKMLAGAMLKAMGITEKSLRGCPVRLFRVRQIHWRHAKTDFAAVTIFVRWGCSLNFIGAGIRFGRPTGGRDQKVQFGLVENKPLFRRSSIPRITLRRRKRLDMVSGAPRQRQSRNAQ